MSKWKILVTLGVVVLLFVFGVSAAYLEAQLLIHHSEDQPTTPTHTPADSGMKYESVELTTDDGLVYSLGKSGSNYPCAWLQKLT
jgi:hypothetical protein